MHTVAQPPARLAALVILALCAAMALLTLVMASQIVGWGLRSPNPIRQVFGLYSALLCISNAWDILQLGRGAAATACAKK